MTVEQTRQALSKTLRNQLERTVTQGRTLVEKAAREEIERIGVGESSAPDYLQPADAKLRTQLRAHGRSLGDVKASDSSQQIDHLVSEVAYEQWHRMLFAYFLAQNNLLICEGYPVSLADCDELAADLGARSGWEAAGFIAASMLPQVFRASSPALKIALPRDAIQQLEQLIKSIHPDTFQAQDALGWLYQFWQSERKEAVNASGVKIGASELSPVTQLFTEPYMVSFLLDNALGAWWANRQLSQNDLSTTTNEAALRRTASVPGVPLSYLRFVKPDAEQPPSEQNPWAPAAGTFEQWPTQLSELTVIDPCCGSGHFLVAAFLMLVPLRMADEGLSAKQAIDAVLSQNLHGLELDQRCVELAAFAIALEAWRYPDENGNPLGYRQLPELQLACSGVAIGAAKGEWKQLAQQIAAHANPDNSASSGNSTSSAQKSNLSIALDWLQQTFQHAPVLGSLINPQRSDAAKIVNWPTLQSALNNALKAEEAAEKGELAETSQTFEAQVAAQGLTKAAQLLSKQYSWVITNVPYLARGKQSDVLKNYCEKHHPAGKNDLATVFLDRCLQMNTQGGHTSVVLPQNWLFLTSYKKFRQQLLTQDTWNMVARLGPKGFQTPMWDFNVQLLGITRGQNAAEAALTLGATTSDNNDHQLRGLDVADYKTAADKAEALLVEEIKSVSQAGQLENPDFRVNLDEGSDLELLSESADCYVGVQTGDDPRYVQKVWELDRLNENWEWFQGTPLSDGHFEGQCEIIRWENGIGGLHSSGSARIQGIKAIDSKAIALQRMRVIQAYGYSKGIFHQNIAVMVPQDVSELTAMYCYVSSEEYFTEIRAIDQKLNVTNGTLVKVPYDKAKWHSVADQQYPNGLPQPYTNDPTQWIFHGHPCGSVVWSEDSKWTEPGDLRVDDTVLQVATARLLGYRWPAELDALSDNEMELAVEQREWVKRCDKLLGDDLVDDDGIVCLPALRGEAAAARRLELMLEAAYGEAWSNTVRDQLLDSVGAKSLEAWLRDKFFEQHCKLFQHRPFIWQVWDGLKDGFSALVNYHKLDANNLDRLIYTYLNDWISQQTENVKQGVDGADIRLEAAKTLRTELEAIKEGEATGNSATDTGYDIFVRWKPLHEQPIGWNPDLNDGVRLNIRPFMSATDIGKKGAGILRAKPNIHWKKDRGKDVPSAPWYHLGLQYGGKEGDRINDHHLTRAEKQQARDDFAKKQAKVQTGKLTEA
ncbi:Eco57I restriction-modification methylase domain-containing protein [Salinibius halmophilus]|uniref:Eco57I restriction-modification methylase domain-containing protein n=1 Tax=Salinibius halmophilus TaxID=1853216 RepID=UPI000E65FDDE|nr:N-6 DNA methylase [Salinibius halmophilus]